MTRANKKPEKKKGFLRGTMSVFFDVPRWISVNQYTRTNKILYQNVRDALKIAKPMREETFVQAMERMGLSEQDLQQRLIFNQRMLTILLVLMALLSLYGLYLVFNGMISSVLVILAVIGLSGVRAFQYSFWNFQIKHKKLGASFKDWWAS